MDLKGIVNFVLICGSQLFNGLSYSLPSAFYPNEALSKGVSVTWSGLVIGSAFLMCLIITPLFGKYMDRCGGAKNLLIIGSFTCGIGNVSFGFLSLINTKNIFLSVSLVFRIITAVGEGAISASAYCLISNQVDKKYEGKAMAVVAACYGAGTFLGPSIGGFLFDMAGYGAPFWITGGIHMPIAIGLVVLLGVTEKQYGQLDNEDVTWLNLIAVPSIAISVFALTLTSTTYSWYKPSLEPFMETSYGNSVSKTGLLFMVYGLSYMIFNPMMGFLMDRGISGLTLQLLGNLFITIAFMFLASIPQLKSVGGVWTTATSLLIQGLGCAAIYVGSLVYMTQRCDEDGLPGTDQVKGMVTSLWFVANCVGAYLGATMGGLAYDKIGFEWGSLVECGVMAINVMVISAYVAWNHYDKNTRTSKNYV